MPKYIWGWITQNAEWVFGGIGLTLLIFFCKKIAEFFHIIVKCLKKVMIEKRKGRNDIIIKITDYQSDSSLSLKEKDKLDKYSLVNKYNNNGKIIIKCDEVNRIEGLIKSCKNNNDKGKLSSCKTGVEKKVSYIQSIIERAFTDEIILDRINNMNEFIEGIIDLMFWHLRKKNDSDNSEYITLSIYNFKESVSIVVNDKEYENIRVQSEDKIKVNSMIYVDEVLALPAIKDTCIWERKILPNYLFYIIINEERLNKKQEYKYIENWFISVS